jgi:hypothetical protein
MITDQTELDYIQAAQLRVAADTRVLKKKATLTAAAGATTIALPDEVIRLEGLYNGSHALMPVGTSDYMVIVTGGGAGWSPAIVCFTVVGRTLNIFPAFSVATDLTAFYSYRPATIDSGATLELSGRAERLVERLASAYALLDDGQPEVGQSELAAYLTDAGRLRREDRRMPGYGGVVELAGRPRR